MEQLFGQLIFKPSQHYVYKFHSKLMQLFFLDLSQAPKHIKLIKVQHQLQLRNWLNFHYVQLYKKLPKQHFLSQLDQIPPDKLPKNPMLLSQQQLTLIWENVQLQLLKQKQLLFYKIYFILIRNKPTKEEYHTIQFLLLNHHYKMLVILKLKQRFIILKEHCLIIEV